MPCAVWVCLFLGFCFFLSCAFLPTYPQTLDLFLSLITSTKTTKKEQNHVNDQLYFWKKPTVMYSQLAYGVSCSAKRQHHLETCHAASLHFISTMKCICRTIPWPQYICRYNCTTSHGCLETTSGLLMWRCKSFPLMPKENFCWLSAEPWPRSLGGWPWTVRHIKIKAFNFLCDKFTWICQDCNILSFFFFFLKVCRWKTILKLFLIIVLLPGWDRAHVNLTLVWMQHLQTSAHQ